MLSRVRALADAGRPDSLATAMRKRRLAAFQAFIAPLSRPLTILDLGGTERFWLTLGFQPAGDEHIVLLNSRPQRVRERGFESLTGDATDLGDFADRSVDVVFSNSMIEHLGEWSAQQRMAGEVRRVGRSYWIQTPNRWFPLEPHFLVPGFQFLPVRVRTGLVQRYDLGWYKRIPDRRAAEAHVRSHRLLDATQMRRLFPDACLLRERYFGLTKSLTAYARQAA